MRKRKGKAQKKYCKGHFPVIDAHKIDIRRYHISWTIFLFEFFKLQDDKKKSSEKVKALCLYSRLGVLCILHYTTECGIT